MGGGGAKSLPIDSELIVYSGAVYWFEILSGQIRYTTTTAVIYSYLNAGLCSYLSYVLI